MHFLHCVNLLGVFLNHLPHLAESSLAHHKLSSVGVDRNFLSIFLFVFLSAVFADCHAIGLWELAALVFQLATGSGVLKVVEVDVAE